jgi:hypothetical protein
MPSNNGDELSLADPGETLVARTPGLILPEDLEFPAFEQLGSFLEEDLPKPPELVKGLFHQGSKIILGGGSKSYKT